MENNTHKKNLKSIITLIILLILLGIALWFRVYTPPAPVEQKSVATPPAEIFKTDTEVNPWVGLDLNPVVPIIKTSEEILRDNLYDQLNKIKEDAPRLESIKTVTSLKDTKLTVCDVQNSNCIVISGNLKYLTQMQNNVSFSKKPSLNRPYKFGDTGPLMEIFIQEYNGSDWVFPQIYRTIYSLPSESNVRTIEENDNDTFPKFFENKDYQIFRTGFGDLGFAVMSSYILPLNPKFPYALGTSFDYSIELGNEKQNEERAIIFNEYESFLKNLKFEYTYE